MVSRRERVFVVCVFSDVFYKYLANKYKHLEIRGYLCIKTMYYYYCSFLWIIFGTSFQVFSYQFQVFSYQATYSSIVYFSFIGRINEYLESNFIPLDLISL